MTDEQYHEFTRNKSMKELLALTPIGNLGEGLRHILNACIKAENNSKAAELFVYIHKINNTLLTEKAEWTVTKDELKKFYDLIKSAKQDLTPMINGQVDGILEQYYAELCLKK